MSVFYIWLANASITSPRSAAALIKRFGSAEPVYRLSEEQIDSLNLPRKVCERLKDKSLVSAENTIEICSYRKIEIITCADSRYPKKLLELPDPPCVLYALGRVDVLKEKALLSVVGTRTPSEYARNAGELICSDISRSGIITVSGLALGCDSLAHRAAIEENTPTIAVIGSGLDRIYPKENANLAQKITQNGVILSEYPPKTPPKRENFPRRNRIIAALGESLLVIESKSVGGSLITAETARKLNRKIYFLPGSLLDDKAAGSNALAKEGGIALAASEDIINEFKREYPNIKISPKRENFKNLSEYGLDECQTYIVKALEDGDRLPEELICENFPISKILANITMLEIKGLVKPLPGGKFSLK